MSERIGLIGLGLMGAGFTRRLIATGHAVIGYDPDRGAHARGGERSACRPWRAPPTVAQAADIILVCVINTAAVEDATTRARAA